MNSITAALEAAFLRLLNNVAQPKDQTMGANGFKTPSRFMAAMITSVLLLLYAISYLAPALQVSWIKSDAKFDAALQQTLLLMLTLSIGYYIGSSKGSADANDVMRAQVAANIPPPAPAPPPLPPTPIAPLAPLAAPAAPVAVTVTNDEPLPVAVMSDASIVTGDTAAAPNPLATTAAKPVAVGKANPF